MPGPLSREGMLKSVVAAATLLSILLEWYSRSCGFLLTSDSLQYLSAAQSFRASGTFLSPDGSHYSYWPPLFPILLNVLPDPIWSATALNLIGKVVIGWLVYQLSLFYLSDLRTRVAFATSVLLGLHLLLISVFIWSELVFVTLALALLHRYTKTQYRLFTGWHVALGFLLCLQRNAGLFWIAGLVVGWMLAGRFTARRLAHALGFFLVSTSGMWAWNIYNTWFRGSDFAFYQQPFFSALPGNLTLAGSTVAAIFLPVSNHPFFGLLFVAALITASGAMWKFRAHALAAPVCIALVFCLGFVAMGPLDRYEMDRYLCVVPVLLYLSLLRGFEIACSRLSLSKSLATLLLIALCSYPLARTLRNAQRWHERSCRPSASANPTTSHACCIDTPWGVCANPHKT